MRITSLTVNGIGLIYFTLKRTTIVWSLGGSNTEYYFGIGQLHFVHIFTEFHGAILQYL